MIKTSLKVFKSLRGIVTKVYHILNLKRYETLKGRKEIIKNVDAVTLALFKQSYGIATKKSLFKIIDPPCTYKTFVVSINRCLELLAKIIGFALVSNRFGCNMIKHTDSTDLPVCTLRKARSHKTMKNLASFSKTSKDWFYGLKLHLSADLNGKIVAIKITSGNASERKVFKEMNKDLDGIFVADAGYTSKELEKEFFIERKRMLLAMPRVNMKKIATFNDIELLKTRMRIEDHFGNMKQFKNLTSTVLRSERGYLTSYLSSILSYMIA